VKRKDGIRSFTTKLIDKAAIQKALCGTKHTPGKSREIMMLLSWLKQEVVLLFKRQET
jgi:hypothetical protein